MWKDVKTFEVSAVMEHHQERPYDPMGQPRFVRTILRYPYSHHYGFLEKWSGGQVTTGFGQPDPEKSNQTQLLVVFGHPGNLDDQVKWRTQRACRKRGAHKDIKLHFNGRKLGLTHPMPLGVWDGMLIIRLHDGSIDKATQALLALHCWTLDVARVANPPAPPRAPTAEPRLILPGDPRWSNV